MSREVREGDWLCPKAGCNNTNWSKRPTCNRCGERKPASASSSARDEALGKEAEAMGGLFSSKDWKCSQCGNINWSHRPKCNVCQHPRGGKKEDRSGRGGAFNDRQEVEYVKRVDSDDEYDDYGRKASYSTHPK
eukprot:TRINITY_DN3949_c0_g1_i2.p1 TRINITY_DN3949_c0_g1~~TRINITY_DN3949_c0_g1_i2.p1  ORF type:complete len:134 (+),score=16.90 TRINITY_DN3949_c0_g1_i2:55-456(+)